MTVKQIFFLRAIATMVIMFILCFNVKAHDFDHEGVYYRITSANTVEVTYRGDSYSSYSDEYHQDVIIPETVIYNDTEYVVTSIGDHTFYGCVSVSSIKIPSTIVSIGEEAFYACSYLSKVYISDIASYCNILFHPAYGNPVYYAENLYLNGELIEDLVIPEGVKRISSGAFERLQHIKSVSIPNSVVFIGDNAFVDCGGLTSVYISDIASYCNIKYNVPSANPVYYAENLYLNGELIDDLVIPEGIEKINDYLFYGLDEIKSVTIPESVTEIGHYAFYECNSISKITCLGTTPPVVSENTFSDFSAYVYVPYESIYDYAKDATWSKFTINDLEKPQGALLQINAANSNGTIKMYIPDNASYSYMFEPENNYRLHSVTFNGEDVTEEINERGIYTSPIIVEDATLNVTFEILTGLEEVVAADRVRVTAVNGYIIINGTIVGEQVHLYTSNGVLLNSAVSNGDEIKFEAKAGEIYIIKTLNRIVKVLM